MLTEAARPVGPFGKVHLTYEIGSSNPCTVTNWRFGLTKLRNLYKIIHLSFDLVSFLYSLEGNWGKIYCGAFCLAYGKACLYLHLRAVFVSLSKPREIKIIIPTPRTSVVFRSDGKGIGFRKQLLCFSTQTPDILIIVAHVNPLSPSIHIRILQTDLHTFPYRIS